MIHAVVFDLDGVLLDSEQLWDQARREVADEHRGRWSEGVTEAMQGMSSIEWSEYMHDTLGVTLGSQQIVASVVGKLIEHYRHALPLLPGAVDAVERIGRRWPLAMASSSNRIVIDTVLELAGLESRFEVTVSSEEVPRGKPAPDVYLEAAHRMGWSPPQCWAIEDSANGIRSASAARMSVVAIPNPRFPPPPEALTQARLVLSSLDDLTADVMCRVDGLGPGGEVAPSARLRQYRDHA